MAGRIREQDVDAVRERARIDEVVRETVTLRAAGGGSLKGLCPFHDERTPSFHVTPSKGLYHCFSCGEGGDTITFVRKVDALSFTEAVEKLAARYGIQLHYEQGAGDGGQRQGQRTRMVEAHKAAAQFYSSQLRSPAAQHARDFLTGRGFDESSWDHFGVGYSPAGWDGVLSYLRGAGFSAEELVAAGLAVAGQRGAYDRFRDRVMWPIRDSGGDTVGFGARKLSEADTGPKYLNTPETAIYRKSHVLYGLDLARRDMAKTHQAVIVEGYTDVMACHLAGVTTAVATCGTAFGSDHVKLLRRILMDDEASRAEVVFTFDGDAAGRKAALKAFSEDQNFVASTYVAVEPRGLDPCDLRTQFGDEAVRELVASRVPLFEFAIRSTIAEYDLATVEGRVFAMRAVAPVLAGIKDPAIRPEYTRTVAGWLGVDQDQLRAAMGTKVPASPVRPAVAHEGSLERTVLKCVLQHPELVGTWFASLEESLFTAAPARAVFAACAAAGDPLTFSDGSSWVAAVLEQCNDETASVVRGLAIEPLPMDEPDERYVQAVIAKVLEVDAGRRVAETKAALQRPGMEEGSEAQRELLAQLVALEQYRREMREYAVGDHL